MADNGKVQCKYGKDCYQKNPAHLSKFSHPSDERPTTRQRARTPPTPTSNENSKKLRSRSPSGSYNLRSPRTTTDLNPSRSPGIKIDTKSPTSKAMVIAKPKTNSSIMDGPSQEKDLDFINDCFDKETRFSQRAEYKQMLKEPKEFIKHKFLVEMPRDFYLFWDFCKENSKKEQKPENLFNKFGLKLLGPFDVLAGKFDDAQMFEPGDYIRHCRYYYDPPEFQVRFSYFIYSATPVTPVSIMFLSDNFM